MMTDQTAPEHLFSDTDFRQPHGVKRRIHVVWMKVALAANIGLIAL